MIGYYIHHHGRGHLERAALIAGALQEPVTALSSLPHPEGTTPFADWIHLGRDDADPGASQHDAGGALHWAPLAAPRYAARMQQISQWLAVARPRLVVVDVSVEVTVLCRTLGVPTVVMAGAGERSDDAHTLAYRLASMIIAPWPGDVYRPAYLRPFAAKTRFAGAMSRFDSRGVPTRRAGRTSVLVLLGAGGGRLAASDVAAAGRATPDTRWRAHGLLGTPWCTDVWSALADADVVVTHAGQNALAEVAAARRPAIVLAQDRPFGEQHATAAALARHGLATVRADWPSPAEWPQVLAQTQQRGGAGWAEWNRGDGAQRAADAVREVLAHE